MLSTPYRLAGHACTETCKSSMQVTGLQTRSYRAVAVWQLTVLCQLLPCCWQDTGALVAHFMSIDLPCVAPPAVTGHTVPASVPIYTVVASR